MMTKTSKEKKNPNAYSLGRVKDGKIYWISLLIFDVYSKLFLRKGEMCEHCGKEKNTLEIFKKIFSLSKIHQNLSEITLFSNIKSINLYRGIFYGQKTFSHFPYFQSVYCTYFI